MMLDALSDARTAGARLDAACGVIGVSARTFSAGSATRIAMTSGVDRAIDLAMRSARARRPKCLRY